MSIEKELTFEEALEVYRNTPINFHKLPADIFDIEKLVKENPNNTDLGEKVRNAVASHKILKNVACNILSDFLKNKS